MQITLSPTRSDARLTLHRAGDTLTCNGTAIDLAGYDPESAPNDWIIGTPIAGADGWQVTLLFPHGAGAPHEALWPEPITLQGDGPVTLPPADPVDPPADEAA